MPRWDRRLRIVLDWTVALFFRPDITKVDVALLREPDGDDSAVTIPLRNARPLAVEHVPNDHRQAS